MSSTAMITSSDVLLAQDAWGKGIVEISSAHSSGGDFVARARQHVSELYAYGEAPVLFKPTLVAEKQFRSTFEEALSYFIGSEGTEDSGFAIKGWTNVRWENAAIYTGADSAMVMGNYYFTAPDGAETKVEFSFGYVRSASGELKIVLHHSSLPYSPE